MTARTHVRVVAFARIAEIAGRENAFALPGDARVRDAWEALAHRFPTLDALAASTRAALNGRIADFDASLSDGDEVTFLPPVGGG